MPTVTGKGEQRRINLLRNGDVNYFGEDGALVQQL
jgi:hypothetical protein